MRNTTKNHSRFTRTLAGGPRLFVVAALLAALANIAAPLPVTQAATITFDAATDGTPNVLGGAAGEDANASGDLYILDGGDLTIQGNGANAHLVHRQTM